MLPRKSTSKNRWKPSSDCKTRRRPLANAGMTTADFEERCDLFRENPSPGHARVPLRIIQPVPPQVPNASKPLLFGVWKMSLKPVLKQWRHSPRQTDDCVTGKLRA